MEPADKPRRAALYGRVSTTEQQPENQLVALRAFATARALWRGADYEPCVVVVKTDGNFSRFLYHCAGRAKCARADYPAVDSAASGPGDRIARARPTRPLLSKGEWRQRMHPNEASVRPRLTRRSLLSAATAVLVTAGPAITRTTGTPTGRKLGATVPGARTF